MSDHEDSLQENYVRYFFIPILLLIFFGIVMVYSSSYLYGKEFFHNSSYFLIKQITFVFLGLIVILVLKRIPFPILYKWGLYAHILLTLVLLMTLIPGIGLKTKGSQRWIQIGFLGLQPGEFIKYTSLFISTSFFENFEKLHWKKIVLNVVGLAAPLVILILQPDFGAFTICLSVILFVAFLSSFPRKLFYTLITVGPTLTMLVLFSRPYRVQRILTYLDPWKDPKNSGFQIIQSYLAFANGGTFGKGLGNSDEKLLYLPEAYNDFIFSIIGEEFGLMGVIAVAIVYILLITIGFQLALKMQGRINILIVSGIVFALGINAFLNMSVVLGLLPTKGLNLPFISYGGSSLISNCFALGIITSILVSSNNSSIKNLVK